MTVHFDPLRWPEDSEAVIEFLVSNEWPFHGTPNLSAREAAAAGVTGDDIRTFWIRDHDTRVGLIKLFDLGDLETGSPMFDLRIAESHRGRGIGTVAVRWLTGHLFSTYQAAHRIEATTRADNIAMQSVFDRCGYSLEGRFVEAWVNSDGTRSDALSYGILRREHQDPAPQEDQNI